MQSLSLQVGLYTGFPGSGTAGFNVADEVREEALTSLERASSLFISPQLASHFCSVHRTILAAVRGNRLRRLTLPQGVIQRSFAVRTLMPNWIGIESWSKPEDGIFRLKAAASTKLWTDAASQLRLTLAHASIWLPESSLGARDNRLLSRDDVQSLRGFFLAHGAPDVLGEVEVFKAHCATNQHRQGFRSPKLPTPSRSVLDLYLPWLQEDGHLAQQVADVWNMVVQCGEADVIKCRCCACNLHFGNIVSCHCTACKIIKSFRICGRGSRHK